MSISCARQFKLNKNPHRLAASSCIVRVRVGLYKNMISYQFSRGFFLDIFWIIYCGEVSYRGRNSRRSCWAVIRILLFNWCVYIFRINLTLNNQWEGITKERASDTQSPLSAVVCANDIYNYFHSLARSLALHLFLFYFITIILFFFFFFSFVGCCWVQTYK